MVTGTAIPDRPRQMCERFVAPLRVSVAKILVGGGRRGSRAGR